jgi:hypothetical protein
MIDVRPHRFGKSGAKLEREAIEAAFKSLPEHQQEQLQVLALGLADDLKEINPSIQFGLWSFLDLIFKLYWREELDALEKRVLRGD